ncbi:MAG: ParB/RepB/Spo0J family partition protein, partial [Enterovibrio sp.]
MAKKRGGSPLGNTLGSEQARISATKANIQTLTQQLRHELSESDESLEQYLQKTFGNTAVGNSLEWQLASGAKATFNELTLSYEQVRDNTIVTFAINGRDQASLTKESLSDLDSLAFQQFYPAVGREHNGKIDVLDGSRRRAWVLLQNGKIKTFRILVTKDELSHSDAKALARQLQTAKEHNQREIGLQCKSIMESGEYTQDDVAQMMGISRPAVSKALKAASIDELLVGLFPVTNLLSHSDYALLDKVMKLASNDREWLVQFAQKIGEKVVNVQPEHFHEERKLAIIAAIKTELKLEENKQKTERASTISLQQF